MADYSTLLAEGIDIESGIMNCGGEEDFYKEVIGAFEEEDNRGGLINAYNNEDWNMYSILVHSLKGTLRLLGATKVGDVAETLQFAAENSEANTIKELHEGFVADMDGAIAKIKQAVGL